MFKAVFDYCISAVSVSNALLKLKKEVMEKSNILILISKVPT